MYKRITALVLAIILLFSGILQTDTVYGTETVAGKQDIQASPENEMEIEAKNSFGTLLSNALETEVNEQQESNGYNIFSIEMVGEEAIVSFEAAKEAILVVGVYDETGVKMLSSGSLEVTAEETEAIVTIETESMPKYFYVRGFLVEKDTLRPLCNVFETPNYTREMQEFFAKTTEDFDEERVLNLDEDITNNFAVYEEDTKVIMETGTTNQLVSTDDANYTYVFENIDENISSLEKGDIFAYEYGNEEVLIVKVASVTVNGTTATVIGEETSLDEVFEYVKIDTEQAVSEVDMSQAIYGEGVTYEGMVENGTHRSRIASYAIEGEESVQKAAEFSFHLDDEKNGTTLKGTVEATVSASLKAYITVKYQYIEFKMEDSLGIAGSFSGKVDSEIDLFKVPFSPIPCINIEVAVAIPIEASAKIEAGMHITSTQGFAYDSKLGVKNLSTEPEVETSLKMQGKFFIGLKVGVEGTVFDEKMLKMSLSGKAGKEYTATQTIITSSDAVQHDCALCYDGDVKYKAGIYANLDFVGIVEEELTIVEAEYKVGDFYICVDKDEMGEGNCPYLKYKVTVTVQDAMALNNIQGAKVNKYHVTDSNGKTDIYLMVGTHVITIEKDGYEPKEWTVEVKAEAQSIIMWIQEKEEVEDKVDGKRVKQLELDGNQAGTLTEDGSLYMWGNNDAGQLGDGTTEKSNVPQKVMEEVISFSQGGAHSGAITEDGSLYMWGRNNFGQLGNGTTNDTNIPIKILKNVKMCDLDTVISGAITKDGSLYMWGNNDVGQLGDGTTQDSYTPLKVLDDVIKVDVSSNNVGAITKDGDLYTWGYNIVGQLGNGTTLNSNIPVKILDDVVDVKMEDTCAGAITKDGSLYMWGNNDVGQLGDGTTQDSYTPLKVLDDVIKVDVSSNNVGAITRDGDLYTWGYNIVGQLGNGTTLNSNIPVKILDDVVDVKMEGTRAGAITKDGSLYMWGLNYGGIFGNGTYENSSVPVKITIPPDDTTTARTITDPIVQSSKGIQNATFSDLLPNETYNFYVMQSRECADVFSSDNLFYILQVTSDSNGKINISYETTKTCVNPEIFVVSAKENSDGKCQHEYTSKIVVAPNCTMEGIQINTCKLCGESHREVLPFTEHNYQSKIEPATNRQYGRITKQCKICGAYGTSEMIPMINDVALSKKAYVYNGKTRKPSVNIRNSAGALLREGIDYMLLYPKTSKDIGAYTVVISFMGNYSGTVKKTYTIQPKSTQVKRLETGSGTIALKWKKVSKQITGYQIQYSTSKKFSKKTSEIKTINSKRKTSLSVKGLKANQKYYIRVRTYKTVKVNGKKTKIYSNWSKAKHIYVRC